MSNYFLQTRNSPFVKNELSTNYKKLKIYVFNLDDDITGIIDNLCHEIVYHKHTGIDYKF